MRLVIYYTDSSMDLNTAIVSLDGLDDLSNPELLK